MRTVSPSAASAVRTEAGWTPAEPAARDKAAPRARRRRTSGALIGRDVFAGGGGAHGRLESYPTIWVATMRMVEESVAGGAPGDDLSQSGRRVQSGRAPRRHQTRHGCRDRQQRDDHDNRDRIEQPDAEQLTLDHLAEGDGGTNA